MMNYIETLNWMFAQLPMYQNQGKSAYKADLSNTIKLADHLKNPESKFRSVHIAGTNGKGSTSHMVASVLQEAGYNVGLYTSPHLKDFRERIRLNGKCISKQFVIQFIRRNKSYFESNSLSFFEMTVGMAFDYFAKKKVDIAIVEVGLGGRLDSTNIISPVVSIITNIGLDHIQFLGDTIEKIAKEKGGVIKMNVPVVIGETQEETESIFRTIAADIKSDIYFADQLGLEPYPSDLKGSYQKKNIITAVQTIDVLRINGFNVENSKLKKGLSNVIGNTGLLGRWQVLQNSPKVICDTAHNKEGLLLTMEQLQNEAYQKLHIVIGAVNDKNLDQIVNIYPKNAIYYFCTPTISRGLDAGILKEKFNSNSRVGEKYDSVRMAYNSALKRASKDDVIYVGGSTFVVAEVL